MKALITEDIKPINVNGFDLFLNKGSINATNPPAIIEIKSVSYTHLTLPTTPYV